MQWRHTLRTVSDSFARVSVPNEETIESEASKRDNTEIFQY